jgi:hypothetical protein
MKRSGWEITHIIDCPLPTQRFLPNMVKRMKKNKTLGVVRRSLIISSFFLDTSFKISASSLDPIPM